MSSFKNAKKSLQKTHRERSQPSKRKQFGLLEKHKDYVLRAKDFHRKEDQLKLLREKARNKNPDEFYYKMIKTKTRDGVHVVEGKKPYTKEQLKMMKSQDLNYARMKRITEKNKIERLQCSLHLIDEKHRQVNSRTVFIDSKQDAEVFEPAADLGLTNLDPASKDELSNTEEQLRIEKARKQAYDELDKRIEREKHLSVIEQQMQLQKNLMGKGKRMKINTGEDGPVVFKWKKQRKK
ncbi:probable U3 small nucleolar RNA-associated protein 11 [Dendronephthya gigantea]|uniref:probable U3 small nucleolar RNA-associated protein 11 n=1 Tax=Dendronephthya gigantea TaxID=151771 RepID=UPI001068DE7A|nr:probable U3 small nucleolar RNA-associated protein 11 [Dendronephthya gigantea]